MNTANSLPAAAVIFGLLVFSASAVAAEDYPDGEIGPGFTEDNHLLLPEGFRRWIFIGSPMTPHGLNGGTAGFPEFHIVYVEPEAFDY